MDGRNISHEVAVALMGSGQQLANSIDNEDRNGCFEFCDGWPDSLMPEHAAIMNGVAETFENETTDEVADALIERVKRFSKTTSIVQSVCRSECPGAYSLFDEDEEPYDDNGDRVEKACPMKWRFERVVNSLIDSEMTPWDKVLGPMYADTALERLGVTETEDLIVLHTEDGTGLYPHAQFDISPDGSLERREKVIAIWNDHIAPLIEEGIISDWSATGMLLQETVSHPSAASLIAQDETYAEKVILDIIQSTPGLRQ